MHIRKATEADLAEAGRRLSPVDLAEFNAFVAGRDPVVTLPGYLDATTRTIEHEGEVLAVGGSTGCLWFVTTTTVDRLAPRHRFEFYRLLKGHLKDIRDSGHPCLSNYVSVDNQPHIRLLTSLGAIFANSTITSEAGCAFRQFWL